MNSLSWLSSQQIAAIASALGAPIAAEPVSPGFKYLLDRFDLFRTDEGTTSTDTEISTILKSSIVSPVAFIGGICSKYSDRSTCYVKDAPNFAIAVGSPMNPSVSTIRRGYITRTCDAITGKAAAVTVLLARRGLTVTSAFTDANLNTAFKIFVPGREPSAAVITSLKTLGSQAQARSGKSVVGWQLILNTLCVSTAADLL